MLYIPALTATALHDKGMWTRRPENFKKPSKVARTLYGCRSIPTNDPPHLKHEFSTKGTFKLYLEKIIARGVVQAGDLTVALLERLCFFSIGVDLHGTGLIDRKATRLPSSLIATILQAPSCSSFSEQCEDVIVQ